MLVSIIIPVYNVEKYLDRCVQSVKEQTYQDLEIILVDDGSTDHSGELCDKYAKADSRMIAIHKENGGLSSARNRGMEIAQGKYITFLDSDDYLAEDFIEKTLKMCEDTHSQIGIMQMQYVAENTNSCVKGSQSGEIRTLSSEEAIEASFYQVLFSCCAPSKLYQASVLKGILFPVGRVSEDLATCHLFLENAEIVSYTEDIGYYYRQRDNSIMHEFNPKRMDAIEWAKQIEEFCQAKHPRIQSAAACRMFNVAVHLLLELPDEGPLHDRCYQEIWSELKRTRGAALRSRKARKREKAAAVLSYGGEKLLKRVWNSKLSVKRKEE